MSYSAKWQTQNARFLRDAMAWLRDRLERHIATREAAPAADTEAASPVTSGKKEIAEKGRRKRGAATSTQPSAGLSLAPSLAPVASVAAGDHLLAPADMDPPPALFVLAERLGFSPFELDLLFLCIAIEFDTSLAGLCGRAQVDDARPYPTFALALSIFEDASWDALSPDRPLRYWRLIEIAQTGSHPLTTSSLRADERITHFVKGLEYVDDRLTGALAPLESKEKLNVIPASQIAVSDAITQLCKQSASTQDLPLLQLVGPDAASAQFVARKAAADLGLTLFRLPAEMLPAHAADVDLLCRIWDRETLLGPVALYLDAQNVSANAEAANFTSAQRFLARATGVVLLGVREAWAFTGIPTITLDVAKPLTQEQEELWRKALGRDTKALAAELAGQFHFSADDVGRVAASVDKAVEDKESRRKETWQRARLYARPRLEALAQRIDAKATWEDLVIPTEQNEQLHDIADQVRGRGNVYEKWGFRKHMNRGLGITALFAGESGTGKTMAAEVIANDLALDLYRIDLSAVVSKYIGETEKNLRRLFDAAEDGGAILFFDEADALFGKRSEVKDSHDRYANIEVNYLLQRMESYHGLAILATNMRSALDAAFTRRLRFIVNFLYPGIAERKRIWQGVFPAETPVAALDIDRLARINLTGGNIHNAALHAAFSAAHREQDVTMPHILSALRSELVKLDRPINEADFRWVEEAKGVA